MERRVDQNNEFSEVSLALVEPLLYWFGEGIDGSRMVYSGKETVVEMLQDQVNGSNGKIDGQDPTKETLAAKATELIEQVLATAKDKDNKNSYTARLAMTGRTEATKVILEGKVQSPETDAILAVSYLARGIALGTYSKEGMSVAPTSTNHEYIAIRGRLAGRRLPQSSVLEGIDCIYAGMILLGRAIVDSQTPESN